MFHGWWWCGVVWLGGQMVMETAGLRLPNGRRLKRVKARALQGDEEEEEVLLYKQETREKLQNLKQSNMIINK